MKTFHLLIVFFSAVVIAVAVTTRTDTAILAEDTKSQKEAMLTKLGAALPLGHPNTIPADIQLVNTGKVLEVLDTDVYTFLQVTTEKDPLWLAAHKVEITKGATVKYSTGVVMSRFHSKALKRTFDLIVFVDSLEQVK